MTRVHAVIMGIVALTSLGTGTVASAQQPASPGQSVPSDDPASLAQARELFEQSVVALRESRHDEACALLGRALRLRDAPSIRRNLAICHRALGHLVEAREHLLAFIRMSPETDPAVQSARSESDALSRRIARLTVATSRRPRGMRVTMDGAPLADAALDSPRPSNPGRHVIEARAPGHLPFRMEIEAAPGADVTVSVALVRNPRVAAEEWISRGRASDRDRVAVRRAERSRPITEQWWFWTGIGVLAAGVAAGATAAIVGSSGGSESPPPGFSGVIETSGR